MGALMVTGFVTLLFLGFPTLTYFYAKQLGRNPKKWFIIGVLLPGLATIILSFLPDLSGNEEEGNKSG